jgi:hypothetical protein
MWGQGPTKQNFREDPDWTAFERRKTKPKHDYGDLRTLIHQRLLITFENRNFTTLIKRHALWNGPEKARSTLESNKQPNKFF